MLPVALMFSYYPVIGLGGDMTMNYELSVPLVWLVVFDLVAVVMMIQRRTLVAGLKNKWKWLILPVWLSLTVIWSLNSLRGLLTVGIIWLVYVAGYGMVTLRGILDESFRQRWWKWFFGAAIAICVWCVMQCILDVAGVPRECTLLCPGCGYRMFGFPHPNGMAIEPQFMGNLLLAPALMGAGAILMESAKREEKKSNRILQVLATFVIMATLFLTFSRGAIYAFGAGLVVMTVIMIVLGKKGARGSIIKRVGVVWLITILSFGFTLNLQGIMTQISPTQDTYADGVAKVLNHLSLGVIDVRDDKSKNNSATERESVEKPVENSDNHSADDNVRGAAVFDGYVAESTDTRLRLTGAAIETWKQNTGTILVGVGLGGAGQALYNNGLSPAPKEIVQNEYASLLLETGVVGILLIVMTVGLAIAVIVRQMKQGKKCAVIIMALLVAYGVSLCFFSGVANALQIYLLPVILYLVCREFTQKKLVKI